MADTSKIFTEALDKMVQELGWHGTADDLFNAAKGPFNEEICKWLYGVGNSQRIKIGDKRASASIEEYRRIAAAEYDKFAKEYPKEAEQITKEKASQYFECFLSGLGGKEYEAGAESSSNLGWILLGLVGVGATAYWFTRRKKR